MQILISGRHIDIGSHEKEVIEEKLGKFEKKLPGLTKTEVIVKMESSKVNLEAILHIAHSNPIVASASSDSILGSLDLTMSKLDKMVKKISDKVHDHHR
ncbi:MAG: ribosome-associated translation inhibitor RaiA [Planctomycetes bacterium]|nr:ribosome-associated translation inhibitor RaiA [Planctomycetota bacterium]